MENPEVHGNCGQALLISPMGIDTVRPFVSGAECADREPPRRGDAKGPRRSVTE